MAIVVQQFTYKGVKVTIKRRCTGNQQWEFGYTTSNGISNFGLADEDVAEWAAKSAIDAQMKDQYYG